LIPADLRVLKSMYFSSSLVKVKKNVASFSPNFRLLFSMSPLKKLWSSLNLSKPDWFVDPFILEM
jgi:hypothetical protein